MLNDKVIVAGGVLLTILVAVTAFKFGAGTKSTKEKATTAQRRSTGAIVGTAALGARFNRFVNCALDKNLTSRERARCFNLQLPPAQRGRAGLAGRPGQPGRQGVPGGRGPRGPQGQPGSDGATGKQGDPGSPCLASVDPDCVGPKGDQGSSGSAGSPGERGPKGDVGSTGSAGPQGDPGKDSTVPGPQGGIGPQGPPGADSTVPGPAGPAGADGAPGATGATGPRGPAITSFTFSFVDGAGNQQTLTCTDPEGDLTYACQ